SLLLSATELFRPLLRLIRQPDHLQQRMDAVSATRFGNAGHHHRQFEILEGRHAGNQIKELKDEAHLEQTIFFQRTLIGLSQVVPIDQNSAFRSAIHTSQQVEQGCFSAATWSHDGYRLARFDLPIDVVQRVYFLGSSSIRLAHPRDSYRNPGLREESALAFRNV